MRRLFTLLAVAVSLASAWAAGPARAQAAPPQPLVVTAENLTARATGRANDVLPGDTVRIDAGQVMVNGRPLLEDYVPEEYRDRVSWGPQQVPRGSYFVLGDHRMSSSDSRTWGFVRRKDIYGKAVFVYWPLDKMGRLR